MKKIQGYIENSIMLGGISLLLYVNPAQPWRPFLIFSLVSLCWAIASVVRSLMKGGVP
jgi:hypothetical protein